MKRDVEVCKLCDEPILPDEPLSPTLFDGLHVHHECGFRAVAGGAYHHLKLCTCCGGDHPPDPPAMSKREAARWSLKVYRWVVELHEVMQKKRAP